MPNTVCLLSDLSKHSPVFLLHCKLVSLRGFSLTTEHFPSKSKPKKAASTNYLQWGKCFIWRRHLSPQVPSCRLFVFWGGKKVKLSWLVSDWALPGVLLWDWVSALLLKSHGQQSTVALWPAIPALQQAKVCQRASSHDWLSAFSSAVKTLAWKKSLGLGLASIQADRRAQAHIVLHPSSS